MYLNLKLNSKILLFFTTNKITTVAFFFSQIFVNFKSPFIYKHLLIHLLPTELCLTNISKIYMYNI